MNKKEETDINQIKAQPCDLCEERNACKLYNLYRPINTHMSYRRTFQQRFLTDYLEKIIGAHRLTLTRL